MLLDLLLQYLRDVEAAIQKLAGAYVERYEEEIPDKVTGVEQPSILDAIEEAKLFAQ